MQSHIRFEPLTVTRANRRNVEDGKHNTIQVPPNSCSQYFNYKKKQQITMFLVVDIGEYGKNSDGGIFANS